MKLLKILLYSILWTLIFFSVFSLFLPSTYRIDGTTVIDAGIDEVYPYILDLQNWSNWNQWNTARDNDVKYVYYGSLYGEGSIMKWQGKRIREGSLKLVKFKPGDFLTYEMKVDSDIATGKILFEEISGFTRIYWTHTTNVEWDPWSKLSAYFLNNYKGPNINIALSRLKKLIENIDNSVYV